MQKSNMGQKDDNSAIRLGAHLQKNGTQFGVYSANAARILVCVFDNDDNEIAQHELKNKTDNIFHGFIEGIGLGAKYGIRAFGEHNAQNGNWFDGEKLLLDPYALRIDRPFELHDEMLEFGRDSSKQMPKAIICEPKITKPKSNIPMKDLVIYELHIKGISENFPLLPEGLKGRFKGLGNAKIIEYFKSLGINAIEIMPCAAWIDEDHLRKLGLSNYWGYNSIGFLSPDPKLAPEGWEEVQECVSTFEAAGIETIIDVVFNHTGEGDKFGPTIAYRGLDNKSYYAIDDNGEYKNFAGCGNVLNCENEVVIDLIIASLRAWRQYGGVHGFRFDLASILGRGKDGFEARAKIFEKIAQDEIIKECKLIAEPWDCAGYNLGQFGNEWGEWNDKFRDCMRRFWLGTGVNFGEFATRFCGSQDVFGNKSPDKSINYVIAHDGFTLRDLVSYNRKHNFANGENNRDGSDNNNSNNHGAEGETDDIKIRNARQKSMRNILTTLILARGTPMLSMGCEIGHTQFGNNNSYAQDNRINYIDWENADLELLEFTKKLISLRQEFEFLRGDIFFDGDENPILKDIEFLNQAALPFENWQWNDANYPIMCMQIAKDMNGILIIINRSHSAQNMRLPPCFSQNSWHVESDSANFLAGEITNSEIEITANSIVILAARKAKIPINRQLDDATLGKLCEIYGIDTTWWDVEGNETQVPRETKIAILRAMGIACETFEDGKIAIDNWVKNVQLRALPHVASFDQDSEVSIEIIRNVSNPPTNKLHLNGDEIEVKISEARIISLANGRKAFAFELLFPPLAIGIYELNFADDLQNSCRLIISPQSAYLPPKLEKSKIFGFSVQLYALQTKNDQGIGDFSTLADTLEICQQNGASILAINPLHALFGERRDLKSPYYPSDRRFLDPIYIDISKFSPVGDFESQKQSKNVDYAGIWNKKRAILLAKFQEEENNSQFLNFCKNAPQALEDFALFEAIDWQFKGNWPQNLRKKNAKAIAVYKNENKDEINFQKYLQFIAQAQFKTASVNRLEIGLNLDLAIGSAPNGSENWCNQELIANGISIGAPPDPLGPQGQIWGLPPYIPHKLLENKLCAIEEIYRANMKNAGALRIDHAMGLMRLFWVPDNMIGAMGAYVQNPFSHILRLIKLLSHEYKCLIIGEDLGTVPFGFSENMQSQNIFSYKVMPFEQDENGFKSPETYPENAFACAFTHDLPPLMGWWENVDIKTREDLGIFDNAAAKNALVSREREKNSILSALIKADLIDEKAEIENLSPKIFAAIHEYLGKCNSKIAIVQIEDLAQMKTMVNLPGTNMEYPNWQRKIVPNLHEIFANVQKLIVPSHIIAAISKNRN